MKLYFSRTEQYAVVVLLLAIIGALFVLSYAYGKRERDSERQPFFTPSAPDASAAGDPATIAGDVVVHVAGAVNKPDVYHLPAGARVIDAVKMAGGTRPDGYPDALNLAERVQDGERLYIPTKAEWQKETAVDGPPALVTRDTSVHTALTPVVATHKATSTAQAAPGTERPEASTTTTLTPPHRGPKELPKAPVNINTATAEELQQLPAVGEKTAQKILDYRKGHGKFTDPSQLIGVGGIGPKKFEKMVPYIKL